MSVFNKRIEKDISDLKEKYSVVIGNNVIHVLVYIEQGRYCGQTHVISMSLTNKYGKYPMIAPTTTFATRIYHPNISPDGGICVDILGRQWTPISSLLTIIESIVVALLNDGNTGSALNADAARDYDRLSEEEFGVKSMNHYKQSNNDSIIDGLF